MNLYMWMYTYVHIYIYIYAYIHICSYMYVCMYVCMHDTFVSICICVFIFSVSHICIYIYIIHTHTNILISIHPTSPFKADCIFGPAKHRSEMKAGIGCFGPYTLDLCSSVFLMVQGLGL